MNQQTDNLIKNIALIIFIVLVVVGTVAFIWKTGYIDGKNKGWSDGYHQGFESAKMLYR